MYITKPQYSWNIAKSGVKHQLINQTKKYAFMVSNIYEFRDIKKILSSFFLLPTLKYSLGFHLIR